MVPARRTKANGLGPARGVSRGHPPPDDLRSSDARERGSRGVREGLRTASSRLAGLQPARTPSAADVVGGTASAAPRTAPQRLAAGSEGRGSGGGAEPLPQRFIASRRPAAGAHTVGRRRHQLRSRGAPTPSWPWPRSGPALEMSSTSSRPRTTTAREPRRVADGRRRRPAGTASASPRTAPRGPPPGRDGEGVWGRALRPSPIYARGPPRRERPAAGAGGTISDAADFAVGLRPEPNLARVM